MFCLEKFFLTLFFYCDLDDLVIGTIYFCFSFCFVLFFFYLVLVFYSIFSVFCYFSLATFLSIKVSLVLHWWFCFKWYRFKCWKVFFCLRNEDMCVCTYFFSFHRSKFKKKDFVHSVFKYVIKIWKRNSKIHFVLFTSCLRNIEREMI